MRWKAAAGLGIDDGGFDASVLTLWRQRLRASGCPERIFDAVREVAAECGALSNKTMRALDSTVLFDAVATQDTVTMIRRRFGVCAAWRRRRLGWCWAMTTTLGPGGV